MKKKFWQRVTYLEIAGLPSISIGSDSSEVEMPSLVALPCHVSVSEIAAQQILVFCLLGATQTSTRKTLILACLWTEKQ